MIITYIIIYVKYRSVPFYMTRIWTRSVSNKKCVSFPAFQSIESGGVLAKPTIP